MVQLDVRDLDRTVECLDGCAAVVHLAAIVSVSRSLEAPGEVFWTNVGGTVNMLEAARRTSCDSLVYASSQAVYGNNAGAAEDDEEAIDPISPYALSKWQGEEQAHSYERVYGLPVISLRYSHIYSDQHSGGFLQKLRDEVRASSRVLRLGPDVSRDFLHVRDAASVILEGLRAPTTGRFNVGTGVATRTSEVAARLAGLEGKELEVRADVIEYRPRHLERLEERANTDRLCRRFDWRPSVSLDLGLRQLSGTARSKEA